MKYGFSFGVLLFGLCLVGAGCVSSSTPLVSADLTSTPATSTTPATSSTTPDPQVVKADLIQIAGIANGQTITNPLTIKGQARGAWYFEASFPIELRNASGAVVAATVAQAQGDWMTEQFVPFTATLIFPSTSSSVAGTLVLKKDNPSGEPQFDDALEIPVQF